MPFFNFSTLFKMTLTNQAEILHGPLHDNAQLNVDDVVPGSIIRHCYV